MLTLEWHIQEHWNTGTLAGQAGLAGKCMPVQFSFNSYRDTSRRTEALDTHLSLRPDGLFCSLFDLGMEEIAYIRSKGIHPVRYQSAGSC